MPAVQVDYVNLNDDGKLEHMALIHDKAILIKITDFDGGRDSPRGIVGPLNDRLGLDQPTPNDDLFVMNLHPAIVAQAHFEELYVHGDNDFGPLDFDKMNCGSFERKNRTCSGTLAIVEKGNRLGPPNRRPTAWPIKSHTANGEQSSIPHVGVQLFYMIMEVHHSEEIKSRATIEKLIQRAVSQN